MPDLRGRARIEADTRSVRARTSESLLLEVFLALLVDAARSLAPDAPDRVLRLRLEADVEAGCAVVSVASPSGSHAEIPESDPGPRRPGFVCDPCLSFSHGIVTALGGTLAVLREPGSGSTATVRLPLDLA